MSNIILAGILVGILTCVGCAVAWSNLCLPCDSADFTDEIV